MLYVFVSLFLFPETILIANDDILNFVEKTDEIKIQHALNTHTHSHLYSVYGELKFNLPFIDNWRLCLMKLLLWSCF